MRIKNGIYGKQNLVFNMCLMKKPFLFILIFLPTLLNAQLSDDGKSVESSAPEHENQLYPNTLFISAIIPNAPFGIKYQYCKSVGIYASLKYDVLYIYENELIGTLGISKTLGRRVNLYLGFGLVNHPSDNYVNYKAGTVIESGIILSFGRISIDLGGGIITNNYQYQDYSISFSEALGTAGIGFKF